MGDGECGDLKTCRCKAEQRIFLDFVGFVAVSALTSADESPVTAASGVWNLRLLLPAMAEGS